MASPALLSAWYDSLEPRHVDLVGDYAGAEFFLIEGDSLLRWAFSDDRIDFGAGFQLLHAVYAVEKFLALFKGRRCNFAVAFLDDSSNICVPPTANGLKNAWKYKLARAAIVAHLLSSAGTDGKVLRFKSHEDVHFQQYLANTRPYFVVAHDGIDVIDAVDIAEEDRDAVRGVLLANIKGWMDLGMNVVLINDVVFAENKIFARVAVTATLEPVYLTASESAPSDAPPAPHISYPSLPSSRSRLAVAAVSKALEGQDPATYNAYAIFLLHTAMLAHLTLPERAFALPENAAPPAELTEALTRITAASRSLLEENAVDFAGAAPDLADYVDGRLLLKLHLITPSPIAEAVTATFTDLTNALPTPLPFPTLTGTQTAPPPPLPPPPPPPQPTEDDETLSTTDESITEVASLPSSASSTATLTPTHTSILAFTHPLFDPFLSTLALPPTTTDSTPKGATPDAPLRESTTWQTARKVVVAAPIKSKKPSLGVGRLGKVVASTGKGQSGDRAEKRAAGKMRKGEQLYSNQMNRYAASLTDSVDGSLNPKLIVVEEKDSGKGKARAGEKPAVVEKKKVPVAAKGGAKKEPVAPKGKATNKLSAAEIIRQNNANKKAGKEAKLQDYWNNFIRDLKKTTDDEEGIHRLDIWLKETTKTMAAGVAENLEWPFIEVEARLCKVQLLQRIWIGYCKRGEQEKGFSVAAVLYDEARKILGSKGLTQKAFAMLANAFDSLAIAAPPSGRVVKTLPDRKLGAYFDGVWTGKAEGVDAKLGMSSEEFQLLHCGPWMDRNMDSAPDPRVGFEPDGWQRRVLDELDSDNSALVVAPTSAGKTFIAFYAMEKILKENDENILVYVAPTKALVNQIAAEVISRFKKNYRYAGKSVWAIDQRDFTVGDPRGCQILITVPHVLQAMLMSPLNAINWTPRVKRIIFDEVHSIGNAEDGAIWEQLLLLAPCPIIALSATVGNPDEFTGWLEATQLALGTKLNMVQHPQRYSDLRKFVYVPPPAEEVFGGLARTSRFRTLEFAEGMVGVHPIAALGNAIGGMPDDLALEPRDCLQLYWALVKAADEKWTIPSELDYKVVFGAKGTEIKKKDVVVWEAALKSVVRAWMKDPASPFAKVVEILAGEGQKKAQLKIPDNAREDGYLHKSTLKLLQSLHLSNALPAILFNYERKACEELCEEICAQLETAETEWRATNPKWTSTVKAWEAHMASKSARGAKVAKISKPEAGQTKNDMMRDAGELESSYLDRFDPKYPSAEFSFADTKKHGVAELEGDIEDLIKWGVSPMLVNAFKRGIGVHHSGLNKKYRQQVEMLFRKGYLRVVIATGTLSLGINMPTRTTVFAGDSLNLNALNYRQASGRAGRRGFDNLGNVVFHGLSLDKVDRLISSKLPSLLGHFPITTSLVLRMFILLHSSKEAEAAKRTVNSLLTQHHLVLGGEVPREQVFYHIRFSIELLRKQKLIGATGIPLNFSGLVGHLYYTQDAAFALHTLLCSGYLRELCRDIDDKPEKTCNELMLVMSHLFGRLKKRHGVRGLPPMPAGAAEALKKQNDDTLKTYTTYVETFAKEHCKTPDNTLPFTGLSCGAPAASTAGSPARSAFVALSGHTDTFTSPKDMATGTRREILPEGSWIPWIPVEESEVPNGYLYDYYRHSDVKKLEVENGIRPWDMWFRLKDFSDVLAIVVPGIVCFLKDGPGEYYDVIGKEGDESGEIEEVEVQTEEKEGEEEEMIKKSESFGNVLKAFKLLKATYNEKFKLMWA